MPDDQISGGVRAKPAPADGISGRFATLMEKYGAGPEAVRTARDHTIDRLFEVWRVEVARPTSFRGTPSSNTGHRPRRWSLSALAGADPTLLLDLPGTRLRYTTLGASMLVSALVAGASVCLALSQLGFGTVAGPLGGVAFGALALVLQRVTVVSLVGHGGKRITGAKRVLSVLPQIVFGFITAIVISVPLVLAVFRPEIEKQLVVSQLERTAQIQQMVETERKTRRLPLEEDLVTTTDPAVRDDIRRRLDQIDTSAAQTMNLAIADARDSSGGLLARLEALSELRASNATLDTAVWTLVSMFALISFLPTLLASMQRIQPANAYHLLIHVREQYVPRERELDELRKQIRVVSEIADREDVDLPAVETLNARLESLTETVSRDKEEVLGQVVDLDARRNRKAG